MTISKLRVIDGDFIYVQSRDSMIVYRLKERLMAKGLHNVKVECSYNLQPTDQTSFTVITTESIDEIFERTVLT